MALKRWQEKNIKDLRNKRRIIQITGELYKLQVQDSAVKQPLQK